MTRYHFPKTARVRKSAEFEQIFQQRCSFSDRLIVVYFAVGKSERPRLGLVVSRKVGNAAVRNRWKRALREAFRCVQHELPGQFDLVVLPRRGAQPIVAHLKRSFQQLTRRAAVKLVPTGGKVRP